MFCKKNVSTLMIDPVSIVIMILMLYGLGLLIPYETLADDDYRMELRSQPLPKDGIIALFDAGKDGPPNRSVALTNPPKPLVAVNTIECKPGVTVFDVPLDSLDVYCVMVVLGNDSACSCDPEPCWCSSQVIRNTTTVCDDETNLRMCNNPATPWFTGNCCISNLTPGEKVVVIVDACSTKSLLLKYGPCPCSDL